MITRELYLYIVLSIMWIRVKFGNHIKIIYTGDYWQLPPIGEEISIVFDIATESKNNIANELITHNKIKSIINKGSIDYELIAKHFMTKQKWPIYKLTTIMRFNNDKMKEIITHLNKCIASYNDIEVINNFPESIIPMGNYL